MKNVRLEDIAKRLNLTKVSISKALRNHPDISKETIRKVKEVAAEMGYRPNRLARSLTAKKTYTIGVVLPKIAHFFFSSVVEGIYNAAYKNEYEVILGVSLESEELERRHIESMLNMRVDGILVSVSEQTKDATIFDEARKMGVDIVFFDRGFVGTDVSFVKVADRISARDGVKHLIDAGYTNIAHLSGYSNVEIARDRRQGYLDAMQEAGLKPGSIVEGGMGEKDGYAGFAKIATGRDLPEAVFAVTYPVGLGVLQYLREHGIDPDKIRILTFGQSEFNHYLSHPFLCINQPSYELGVKAFQVLLEDMGNDEYRPAKIIELPANVGNGK